MARALSLLAKTILLTTGAIAAGLASAGNPAGEAPKKVGNSFILLYGATPSNAPVVTAGNGTGLPPGKAVVVNPYNVPLIQNAGSLRPGH